jgi:hypothetical protein
MQREFSPLSPQLAVFLPHARMLRCWVIPFLPSLLTAAMLVPERVSAAEWPDLRVYGPFVCRADFALDRQQRVLSELAELQSELVESLGLAPAREPIEVYLFHDESTYRRYLKRIYPTLPFRRAFFVKENGLGRVFAYDSSAFETDLRHECTHALLHAVLPVVPLWLDEGLASYFEVPAGTPLNKATFFSGVLWNVRFGSVPSIEKLEKIESVEAMGKAEYRDSWAWVHFICQGPPAVREELAAYLRDLAAQRPPGLLSERLNRRVAALSTEFKTHIKRTANASAVRQSKR